VNEGPQQRSELELVDGTQLFDLWNKGVIGVHAQEGIFN
jgi:hypothetical protein